MTDNKLAKKDVGTQVLERVNQLCEAGFTLPHGYSAVNAVKASMLVLQETVDKNKRPALEVCTPVSIQKSLFKMVTYGMDVSLNQGYFLVRGDKLCFQPSYFGHILQVKRLFPDWSPVAHTVREGDEFEYTINPENGKMKLVKHTQKLENLDKDFIGAYMYLPCADGEPELYVMTRKQIMRAWSKSSSQSLQTHKDFDEKMALKTIINSGCTKVINATPDPTYVAPDEDPNNFQDPVGGEETNFVEFEEVQDEHKDVVEEQPKEEPQQPTQEQTNDDEF
jgi:recombination protein RecT